MPSDGTSWSSGVPCGVPSGCGSVWVYCDVTPGEPADVVG